MGPEIIQDASHREIRYPKYRINALMVNNEFVLQISNIWIREQKRLKTDPTFRQVVKYLIKMNVANFPKLLIDVLNRISVQLDDILNELLQKAEDFQAQSFLQTKWKRGCPPLPEHLGSYDHATNILQKFYNHVINGNTAFEKMYAFLI